MGKKESTDCGLRLAEFYIDGYRETFSQDYLFMAKLNLKIARDS